MDWLLGLLLLIGIVAAVFAWFAIRRELQVDRRKPSPRIARPAPTTTATPPVPKTSPQPGSLPISQPTPRSATSAVRPISSPPSVPIARALDQLRGLRWLGRGTCIRIGDLELPDPLTYFRDSRAGGRGDEPAAIDLALNVARHAQVSAGRELPYWPQYDGLTSGQRRYYLEWMASGRRRMPSELGYVFLFIYGLERRALADEVDQQLVFDEILRLRRVYAASGESPSRSFDSYTSSFLWYLVARFPGMFSLERVQQLMADTPLYIEENLAAALCWFASTQTPLPDWFAFAIANDLPQAQRSVVTKRVPEEFRKLYCAKYRERFGPGLELRVSRRSRLYSYKPASAALPHVQFNGVNPLGVSQQFLPLVEIWNQCIVDLKKLSSVVAREGQEELTVTAWEAMPPELRATVDHPLTEGFCKQIDQMVDADGRCTPRAGLLASALSLPQATKYTPSQARKMCETAAFIGYGIEPDARLTGKGYAAEDRVAVFLRTIDEQPDPVRYNAAACMLRVGIAIAAADGNIHPDELAVLTQQLHGTFELNNEERLRLDALRSLLLLEQIGISSISKLAKGMSQQQRDAVAKLALAIVAADGVITPEELKAVRLCYSGLGYERAEIERTLNSLGAKDSDEPVTVLVAQPGTADGEPIPTPPEESTKPAGLKLDRAAIAAIMMDTQEVARMLAAAMSAEGAVEIGSTDAAPAPAVEPATIQAPVPPSPADVPAQPLADPGVLTAMSGPPEIATTDSTLPQRYAAFFQILMTRGEWTI